MSTTKALESLGFFVIQTPNLGDGKPDYFVIGNHQVHGIRYMIGVEQKTETGKLNKKQQKFHNNFEDDDPIIVAVTIQDVLKKFGWDDDNLKQLS